MLAARPIPSAPATVVCFTSPKGGVGKSTTAANVAAELARSTTARVLLVDGDVANGNLALRITQQLEPNLLDLIDHMDEVLPERRGILPSYARDLAPFVRSPRLVPNLDVLAAPENPDVIEQIEDRDLRCLMDTWRRHYAYVVVDTGTQIVEHTNVAWLSFSNPVFLVVEPELACFGATAEYAKRAARMQLVADGELHLVVTRFDVPIESIDVHAAVEDVFGFVPRDRRHYLPDVYAAATSSNNGAEFLVFHHRRYAEAVASIVSSVRSS